MTLRVIFATAAAVAAIADAFARISSAFVWRSFLVRKLVPGFRSNKARRGLGGTEGTTQSSRSRHIGSTWFSL